MARKWRITAGVWIGFFVVLGAGSVYRRDVDLFLLILCGVLLFGATVYTAFLWVRDFIRGEPEKLYHLSAYPRSFLRFAFDEPEDGTRPRAGAPNHRRSAREPAEPSAFLGPML